MAAAMAAAVAAALATLAAALATLAAACLREGGHRLLHRLLQLSVHTAIGPGGHGGEQLEQGAARLQEHRVVAHYPLPRDGEQLALLLLRLKAQTQWKSATLEAAGSST